MYAFSNNTSYKTDYSRWELKKQDLDENDFECNRMLCFAYLTQHKFNKAEEYGKRAFDLNPNDPRVSSGYGEVLIRVGRCEEGIELLKKALELDPVPMGQTNSDKRLSDLLLGYFLFNKPEECLEIGGKLQNIDFRSWLILLESNKALKKNDGEFKKLVELCSQFKDRNFNMEIDRFHIQDQAINKNLINTAKELLG